MFMGNKNIPFKQNTQCEVREKKILFQTKITFFRTKPFKTHSIWGCIYLHSSFNPPPSFTLDKCSEGLRLISNTKKVVCLTNTTNDSMKFVRMSRVSIILQKVFACSIINYFMLIILCWFTEDYTAKQSYFFPNSPRSSRVRPSYHSYVRLRGRSRSQKKYDYFAVQSKTYFSCLFHCFYQTDTTFLCLFASLDFSLLTYISLSLTDDRSVSVHMKFLFVYLFIFIFSVCFTCKLSAVFSSLPLADSPPRDPQINAYK